MTQASEGLVEALAEFSSSLSLDDVPQSVVTVARRCVLDTLGVIVAGQASPLTQKVLAHAENTYSAGEAQVLGAHPRLHPCGTALANATAGHAYDFDDTSYTGIMHGSVVVLPAALAVAEQHDVTGWELLTAFIAGVEGEYALAERCTHSVYFKGWWTTSLYGVIGAAAASSRLLQLSPQQTRSALGMAMTLATGMKSSFGTDAKPLGAGLAAAKGIECAYLARSGVTGPGHVFESGFSKLIGDEPIPASDLALGRRWRLHTPGILFKTYPVCSAAQAGAQMTADLLERHKLKADEIERVICDVPPLVKASLIYDQPASVPESQFSMPFAVGCMLRFGRLSLAQLHEDTLADAGLRIEMSKVVMRVTEELSSDPTVIQRCPEGAGVHLISKSGKQYYDFLAQPLGMPGNPMSDDALVKKANACLRHTGLKQLPDASVIASMVWDIENVSVRSMTSELGLQART